MSGEAFEHPSFVRAKALKDHLARWADRLAALGRALEAPALPAWMDEMRKQAEFDRDRGSLNTIVDNHCLLDLLRHAGGTEHE